MIVSFQVLNDHAQHVEGEKRHVRIQHFRNLAVFFNYLFYNDKFKFNMSKYIYTRCPWTAMPALSKQRFYDICNKYFDF